MGRRKFGGIKPALCKVMETENGIEFIAPKLDSTTLTQILEEDKKYGKFTPANGSYFTYAVLNEDDEMTNKQVLKSIKYSHRRIELRTNLKFKRVRGDEHPDFKIEFRTVESDPEQELTFSTLMYHYFPINSITHPLRGLCVVNKGFYWTTHGEGVPLNVIDPIHYPTPTDKMGKTYDFDQVYTHELLHGLGLPHSKTSGNVMSSNYGIMAEYLSDEDIARLVAKYGSRNLNEHLIKRWLGWLFHASDR